MLLCYLIFVSSWPVFLIYELIDIISSQNLLIKPVGKSINSGLPSRGWTEFRGRSKNGQLVDEPSGRF